ncbi:sensor domain-containing diguanylate cyclase [Phreatobacter sp.]|uniref:sensor domain-containing diguanylate cyclase n=1 Tax=Phreatobacter sp. TaxID=1966341 RepID=UPI0025D12415|nr:sensor domain-containing diguanylate cyclase [Phreatobacter sp.]
MVMQTSDVTTGNFASASRRALQFLQERFGLGLWMVTRVDGDNWVVLTAEDRAYGFSEGTVLKWSDSFCSRMVEGLGPNIAPESSAVDAYAGAPVGRQIPIGAYVGFPLVSSDGVLFGTLCAIDPQPQSPGLTDQVEFIRLVADLLSELLRAELKAVDVDRRLERAVDQARRDELTSLYNRRGWVEFLEFEERRCRRYGHPACVIAVDLDDLKRINDLAGHAAGDDALRTAARALSAAVRGIDIVARTGGDEFMVLCIECDAKSAGAVVERVRGALAAAGIRASIGMAMRTPEAGLSVTAQNADQAMYRDKALRKERRLERSV